MQVLSSINVRFEFGSALRSQEFAPEVPDTPLFTESLIKVYATKAIAAGDELVAHYGQNFWHSGKLTDVTAVKFS